MNTNTTTKYALGIDQGTTSTTIVLINAQTLELVDKVSKELTQFYPADHMVEHDLEEIWNCVTQGILKIIERNPNARDQIVSVGITNQRETVCAYRKNGTPLARAIVWQDARTKAICQKLRDHDSQQLISKFTTLPIDPYFSASKMLWLLENNADVQKASQEKDLYLTTVDSFLLYRITNGNAIATEPSNASRTMLMDIHTTQWENSLCNLIGINKDVLAPIKDSFGEFGKTKGLASLPDGIPVSAILGDQQAALFGQCGFTQGVSKCTYGTGAFLLVNTGDKAVISQKGLITTVAYRYNSKACYALEGSSFIAGSAVKWLRDNLKLFEKSSDIEEMAKKANLKEMEALLFLPFFTGIGSPYWISGTNANIIGLTQSTTSDHLARACLEGIALSVEELLVAMEAQLGTTLKSLRVDGGASENSLLCQIQSNFGKREIIRPKIIETTGFGVAVASLVGIGALKMDEIAQHWKIEKNYQPENLNSLYYKMKKRRWMEYLTKLYL